MNPNIGPLDRIVRIVLGLVILAVGYYYKSWWGVIGLLPILTAAFRFCPAYTLLGLNTCGSKKDATPSA